MLVLSRQRDETIMIGDQIELTIVDIRGEKVRVGIKAPSAVPVHRKEVYQAIQHENELAAQLIEDLPALASELRTGGKTPSSAKKFTISTQLARASLTESQEASDAPHFRNATK